MNGLNYHSIVDSETKYFQQTNFYRIITVVEA